MFRKPYSDLSRQGKSKRRKKILEELRSQVLLPEHRNEIADGKFEGHDYFQDPGSSNIVSYVEVSPESFDPSKINTDELNFDHDPLTDSGSDDEYEDLVHNLDSFESVKEGLRDWVIKFKINHIAVVALLSILKTHECLSKLPTDPRTLLKTPKQVISREVEPGSYSHLGLAAGLKKIWERVTENVKKIELLIGIDGLPLFQSSGSELWPILGKVCNVDSIKALVFPIGLYCGKGKPKSADTFLSEFVDEIKLLFNEGFLWKGQLIPLSIKGFILDAPAKSFVLNTKGHTGYYSCTKCTQRGLFIHNRMTFQDNDAPKRTHDSFLSKADGEFHHSSEEIVLEAIPGIDFIANFPLDYMHLVCLGVVRTLMYLWIFSKPSRSNMYKLPSYVINLISRTLISFKQHIPLEFNRKPRSLEEIKRWKATEFRQFLLYTGPVVLKDILVDNYKPLYDHFLSLSISMYILLSPKLIPANRQYVDSLLKSFIDNTKQIYGEQYITHNIHGLTHLVDCLGDFGPLESGSAFPFENFLQVFKKLLRKGEKPLEQIVKRSSEIMNSNSWFTSISVPFQENVFPKISHYHNDGPLLSTSDGSRQFSCLDFASFLISKSHPNNCCILASGSIVTVENIVFSHKLQKFVILYREFLGKDDFYSSPFIQSSQLGIFILSKLSSLQENPCDEIVGKVVLMPFKGKHIGIPLIHSEN